MPIECGQDTVQQEHFNEILPPINVWGMHSHMAASIECCDFLPIDLLPYAKVDCVALQVCKGSTDCTHPNISADCTGKKITEE